MTRVEVEGALGVPPGDYATNQEARNRQECVRNFRPPCGPFVSLRPSPYEDTVGSWVEHWLSDEAYVYVRFRRSDGTVLAAGLEEMPRVPFLDRLRGQLSW
jgi:hypothetical protein